MVDHHLQGLQPVPEKAKSDHQLFKTAANTSFLNKQDRTGNQKNVYTARHLFKDGRKYTTMMVVLCKFYF